MELKGWVCQTRSSGKIRFLLLRDGTGFCQCIFFIQKCKDSVFDTFSELKQEMSVHLIGKVKEENRSPGGVELNVEDLKILSASKDYPITPKEHGTDFLMNHRHLWLRSKKQHAILRVRDELVQAIHCFFHERDFILTEAPFFTSSSCEGTTSLFKFKYFGKEEAFLSQSGQLYMEATAAAFGKVYCFGPVFRAEKSKTRRHLIEFWMVEPEVAFFDLRDIMLLAEELIEFLVKSVLKNKKSEMSLLGRNLKNLEEIKAPFPRLHYREAVQIIRKENPNFGLEQAFGAQEESLISSKFDRPVFIYNYPTKTKAFYMKENSQDSKESLSFDLLGTEAYGELIGGGQREDNYEKLTQKIREHQLESQDLSWYKDLRKYGSFVHSGFGLGVERTLSWICGLSHLREALPFPRLYDRLRP